MTAQEFRECLISYREDGNDYRYVLTREQVEEICDALLLKNEILSQKSWPEIIKLISSIWGKEYD